MHQRFPAHILDKQLVGAGAKCYIQLAGGGVGVQLQGGGAGADVFNDLRRKNLNPPPKGMSDTPGAARPSVDISKSLGQLSTLTSLIRR